MRIYLASPGSREQANAARDMAVLVSYVAWGKWRPLTDWFHSFERILVDSGAFSELNSGVKVDVEAYTEWAEWVPFCEAYAGLDDIRGDWRRSMENYKHGRGFPSYHDTDPPELLDDLIPLARERGGWLGIGLLPPRTNRETWLRETLERVPQDLHIHGWALGAYTYLPRLDSVDSTHWFREAMKVRSALPWLTYSECLEILVKKIRRQMRQVETKEDSQLMLLSGRG